MSAILSSDDLNDFISPGVACIKPVEIKKSTIKAEIEIGIDGQPVEITESGAKPLQAAQISLSDCLACSGCITSAESVMVSTQSHTEVLKALKSRENNHKIFVCSVSHQVRASLAAAYDLSIDSVDKKLKHLFLNQLGFKHMVGTEVGRALALHYGANEALERYRSKGSNGVGRKGPLLSSNCPGWACYVEKTHEHVVPYLSKVKSAQQITGTLAKFLIQQQYNVEASDIYHLALMPCFDKKLEASRPENSHDSVPDVDCVITTKEIIQLLLDENMESFDKIPESLSPNHSIRHWPTDIDWLSNNGSSSGGYMDYVINSLVSEQGEPCNIETIMGKNSDICEYQIKKVSTGEIVAKVAYVYGFRNIQNVVRKLKPGRSISRKSAGSSLDPMDWDYAEIMACPGGCLNGGGQIGRREEITSKQWKAILEDKYNDMRKIELTIEQIELIIQQTWQERADQVTNLIQAEFHGIDKTQESKLPKALQVGSNW